VKTTDLSKAPRDARAGAVFVGATEYTGVRALVEQLPTFLRLRRPLKRAPGFCGYHITYRFPYTFGQIVLFEEMDQLLRFARSKDHRELMRWVTDGDRNARAVFIRLYETHPGGSYANGAWSADGAAGYDERFTALSTEEEGPFVHPRRAGA